MKNIYALTIYSPETHEYTTIKAYSTLEKALNGGRLLGIYKSNWEYRNVLGDELWSAETKEHGKIYQYRIEQVKLD